MQLARIAQAEAGQEAGTGAGLAEPGAGETSGKGGSGSSGSEALSEEEREAAAADVNPTPEQCLQPQQLASESAVECREELGNMSEPQGRSGMPGAGARLWAALAGFWSDLRQLARHPVALCVIAALTAWNGFIGAYG